MRLFNKKKKYFRALLYVTIISSILCLTGCHGQHTVESFELSREFDVNKNYEPSNCRWVSMEVQSRNRRNVINK